MRIAGVIVVVCGLFAGIAPGGDLTTLIYIPGLLFVLLVGSGIIIAAHGPKALLQALRAGFVKIEESEATCARTASETGIQAFVVAGWLGVFIGVVQMFSTFDDPSQLGQGIAVALLTAFYGYILAYVFCMPLARSLASIDS